MNTSGSFSDPLSRRTAILVLGMHRSGTSALTRVLSLLGCDLPKTLLPASPNDNDLGFWESRPVMELDEKILEAAGSQWDDWRPFNAGWFSSPEVNSFRTDALRLLAEEFGGSSLFAMKEPRICRFAPFWLETLEAVGIAPRIILSIRNPLEVAASLNRRNGIELAWGHLMWLRHVLDAERDTRGRPRYFTSYDRLMTQPNRLVIDAAAALGVSWPRLSIQTEEEIAAFLSEQCRHHQEAPGSVVENPLLSSWLRDTFRILEGWVESGERVEEFAALDRVRSEFDVAAPAFAQLAASGKDATSRVRVLERNITGLQARLDRAETGKKIAEEKRASLVKALTAKREKVAALAKDIEAARAHLAELEKSRIEKGRIAVDWMREVAAALLKEFGNIWRFRIYGSLSNAWIHSRKLKQQKKGLVHSESHLVPLLKAGDRIPHYGAAFHKLVGQAWARTKPVGTGSRKYEAIRIGFDLAYYLMRYADIARDTHIDPIQHYIDHGAKEKRDPSPDFSTRHYVKRYRDVKRSKVNPFYHWLTVGRGQRRIAQPFADFDGLCSMLGRAPAEAQEMLIERRRDLRERFEHGVLGEMVKKATELEPLIAHAWPDAFMAKLLPFHSDDVVKLAVAMHRLHDQAEFRRAKAVVVIPHCRLSGATRIAGHLAEALAQIYGPEELVVLRTDLDIMQFPEWFPADCRHVSLAAEKLPQVAQERLLAELLRSLRPEVVFNVNSRLLWDTLRPYGKALSASMRLYAYFFCNDKNRFGHWNGYPLQKFYRYFDMLSGVVTDSHYLAEELRARYLVPPGQARKIVTLETPVATPPSVAPMPGPLSGRRPQIFWSGRFDRQKRADLVYALARRMPEVDFRLWGEPVLDGGNHVGDPPGNIILEGVYADLADLPLEQCDLWLYTSEWDGVPNILIEIATRGVPLVGSLVGGTGEILKEGLSWPVADIEDIDTYEAGIRAILADPFAARERARQLSNDVLSRRTMAAYGRKLEGLLTLSVILEKVPA